MSNTLKADTTPDTKTTTPSLGKGARNIDPDLNPWERQPNETEAAYAAFTAYRDSEERKVGDHGPTAYRWSSDWSWGYRAFEWDQYLARKDVEDMVRYRRQMNDRHRRASSLAQQKVVQWLMSLDPASLTPATASRWLEVAVKIERLAAGGETERLAIQGQGPIGELTAEEVSEALQGLTAEINRLVEK